MQQRFISGRSMKKTTYHREEKKNYWLKTERNVGFQEVVNYLEQGGLSLILPHHLPEKYPGQYILLVVLNQYVHAVPFLENESGVRLKTIYPCKKFHQLYFQQLTTWNTLTQKKKN